MPTILPRRVFLTRALAALALPLASPIPRALASGPMPRLPLDNPQAKALSYTEDAGKVAHPAYKPGSKCANCQLFNPSTEGCSIFPGFRVAPSGWCTAWAKRAG